MAAAEGPQASQWRADLHLHSTASDGALMPRELVRTAARAGMTHIALTDHETMGGLPEARVAAQEFGVHLIPGVEINTAGKDHVHLLIYFANERMTKTAACFRRFSSKGSSAYRG